MPNVSPDRLAWLDRLIPAGQVTEVRIIRPFAMSGYFDNLIDLRRSVNAIKTAEAVYWTPNPCQPSLLARSSNRIINSHQRRNFSTTSDKEILRRTWLLVDVDPVRPAGISSSSPEHEAALALAKKIHDAMIARGWPQAVVADSGNGGHLMWRIDLPADDGGIVQRCLLALDAEFSDAAVHVDKVTYNPARIWKLYGTLTRKGDAIGDRFHRFSSILSIPDELCIVPTSALEKLAALAPEDKPFQPPKRPRGRPRRVDESNFDLDAWLAKYIPSAKGPREWQGGRKWILDPCPWDSSHTGGSAFVGTMASGALFAGCHHDSCGFKRWHDLRDAVEPGWREEHKRQRDEERSARRRSPSASKQEREASAPRPESTPGGRPLICCTVDIPAVVDEIEAAIMRLPEPVIFQRAHALVRVVSNGNGLSSKASKASESSKPSELFENCETCNPMNPHNCGSPSCVAKPPASLATPPKPLNGKRNSYPMIAPVPADHLTEIASLSADFVQFNGRADDWVPTIPPKNAVGALLTRGRWRFPTLTGIVAAPTLRQDGSVLESPGYDEASGLYYIPDGISYPPISESPSLDEVHRALEALDDCFVDFPFSGDSDRSAAIATVLTLLGRDAIDGAVPMVLVTAHTPGTGKSLLADAISSIVTGHIAPKLSQLRNEEEERKRIISLALSGQPLVTIDNLTHAVGNGVLDGAITSGVLQDRMLSTNSTVTTEWRAVVVATGNNTQVSSDLCRRVIMVSLDAHIERPEQRSGFRHHPLLPWIVSERPRLVVAGLTALRGYIAAGRPSQNLAPLGSFESWSDLVRSALVWAGRADPAAGREQIRQEADPEREALALCLSLWRERYRDEPMELGAVLREISDVTACAPLRAALSSLDRRWDGRDTPNPARVGLALRRLRGRIVDGMFFDALGTGRGGRKWRVALVGEATAQPASASEDFGEDVNLEDEDGEL